MSLYDYKESLKIKKSDYPFYSLIMAAMRQADTENVLHLQTAFPEVWDELLARYNTPGGVLHSDKQQSE